MLFKAEQLLTLFTIRLDLLKSPPPELNRFFQDVRHLYLIWKAFLLLYNHLTTFCDQRSLFLTASSTTLLLLSLSRTFILLVPLQRDLVRFFSAKILGLFESQNFSKIVSSFQIQDLLLELSYKRSKNTSILKPLTDFFYQEPNILSDTPLKSPSPAMTRSRNKKAQLAHAAAQQALLTTTDYHNLEGKLGYIFADRTILQEALQAAGNGVTKIGERKIEDGNKRLAMLGDSILQVALLKDWFIEGESRRKFPSGKNEYQE